MNLLPGDSCPFPGQLPAGETADVWYGVWIKWVRLQLERDLICKSRPREMGGGGLESWWSWWSYGKTQRPDGIPTQSICGSLSISVCVCLTSPCTPPVSQHTLIGSDLGTTHHMPTPLAPSDLYLSVSSFPLVHSCISAPHLHTLLLSPGVPLFLFDHISQRICSFSLVWPNAMLSTVNYVRRIQTMEAQKTAGRLHQLF